MSEPSNQPPEPTAGNPAVRKPGRKPWQVGLRTMFLLTAAIAVWITYFVNRRENAVLESRITALRPIARELVIDDPTRIAVVKLEELWYDENRWNFYLPDGAYRVCLATRGIDGSGLAPVVKSAPVGAGKHRLALEQTLDKGIHRISVTWDASRLLEAAEPKEWNPGRGSSGGGLHSVSTQWPADQPVVLFRRRFSTPSPTGQVSTPVGPTEGILLWMERTGPARP